MSITNSNTSTQLRVILTLQVLDFFLPLFKVNFVLDYFIIIFQCVIENEHIFTLGKVEGCGHQNPRELDENVQVVDLITKNHFCFTLHNDKT